MTTNGTFSPRGEEEITSEQACVLCHLCSECCDCCAECARTGKVCGNSFQICSQLSRKHDRARWDAWMRIVNGGFESYAHLRKFVPKEYLTQNDSQ